VNYLRTGDSAARTYPRRRLSQWPEWSIVPCIDAVCAKSVNSLRSPRSADCSGVPRRCLRGASVVSGSRTRIESCNPRSRRQDQIPLLERLWQSQRRMERSYARAQPTWCVCKNPVARSRPRVPPQSATGSETQHSRHMVPRDFPVGPILIPGDPSRGCADFPSRNSG